MISDQPDLQVWELVASVAGRDAGQSYLVCELGTDGFARLTDGDRRRVEAPKKKNIRHLRRLGARATELANKFDNGAVVKNVEVRDALRRLLEEVLPGSAEE
jgi:large subunit ribosomal protein L14e